jgi:hypothetical protein
MEGRVLLGLDGFCCFLSFFLLACSFLPVYFFSLVGLLALYRLRFNIFLPEVSWRSSMSMRPVFGKETLGLDVICWPGVLPGELAAEP